MKSAGKARSNGLYRHIRTSKEIIRNLLNYYTNIKPTVQRRQAQAAAASRQIPKQTFLLPRSPFPSSHRARTPRTVCSGGSAFSCYFPMYALRMAAISARVVLPFGARWLLSRPTMSRRAFAHCIASIAQAGICPASL